MNKRDFLMGLLLGLSFFLFYDNTLARELFLSEKSYKQEEELDANNSKVQVPEEELSESTKQKSEGLVSGSRSSISQGAVDSVEASNETESLKFKKLKSMGIYEASFKLCDSIWSPYGNPFRQKDLKLCEISIQEKDAAGSTKRALAEKFFSSEEILHLAKKTFGGDALSQHIFPAISSSGEANFTIVVIDRMDLEKPIILKTVSDYIRYFGEIDSEEKATFYAENFLKLYQYHPGDICDGYQCRSNPVFGKKPYLQGPYWIFENYLNGYGKWTTGQCREQYYTIAVSKRGKARIVSRTYIEDENRPENCRND